MKSDEELINDFLAGDDDALQELKEGYWAELIGYLVGSLRLDYHEAEDCVQTAFFKVVRTRERVQARYRPSPGTSVRTWLRRIAKNEALAQMRRHRPLTLGEDEKLGTKPSRELDPAENAATCELSAAIEDCLHRLSPALREVLKLRMDNCGNREIGQRLHIPYATVGSRVHNARQQMKDCLKSKGV